MKRLVKRYRTSFYEKKILASEQAPKKYFLVLVGIFKNEQVAMREWLLHHMRQGVEHFYLINNGSTDNWEPEISGLPVTVQNDATRGQQVRHYNHHFKEVVKQKARWVMINDLDEFVYARKGKTIASTLREYDPKVRIVYLRWKMFGSSGHIQQPKSIIHGFTMRKKLGDGHNLDDHVKYIVRTSVLKKFGVHDCQRYNTDKEEKVYEPATATEEDLVKAKLQLNHYAVQSKQWYDKVKVTRGSVQAKNQDNLRNQKYFKDYDFKDISDTELTDITPSS